MKKVYLKPEIEETNIEYSSMILTGSNIQGSGGDSTGITGYEDEDDIEL
jgi:hypothetical protein